MNVIPQTGVNVLDVMDGLKATIKEMEQGVHQDVSLSIEQLYDETIYNSVRWLKQPGGNVLVLVAAWFFLQKNHST